MAAIVHDDGGAACSAGRMQQSSRELARRCGVKRPRKHPAACTHGFPRTRDSMAASCLSWLKVWRWARRPPSRCRCLRPDALLFFFPAGPLARCDTPHLDTNAATSHSRARPYIRACKRTAGIAANAARTDVEKQPHRRNEMPRNQVKEQGRPRGYQEIS
jgi:hypothetical protein